MDFKNSSFETLLFSNEQILKNTAKSAKIQDTINNTRKNQFRDMNLGKLQQRVADYPYNYDIYNYKYGNSQSGSYCKTPLYGKPISIRPSNDYVNGYNSDLLLNNKNREVIVGGKVFKNSELRLPKPKIISY